MLIVKRIVNEKVWKINLLISIILITKVIQIGEFDGVKFIKKILCFLITIIKFIIHKTNTRFKFNIIFEDWDKLIGIRFDRLKIIIIIIIDEKTIKIDLLLF